MYEYSKKTWTGIFYCRVINNQIETNESGEPIVYISCSANHKKALRYASMHHETQLLVLLEKETTQDKFAHLKSEIEELWQDGERYLLEPLSSLIRKYQKELKFNPYKIGQKVNIKKTSLDFIEPSNALSQLLTES